MDWEGIIIVIVIVTIIVTMIFHLLLFLYSVCIIVIERSMQEHRQALPDNMSTKEVALQQEVVHKGHEQQQRRKAAGNEGHKVGHLGQPRGGELLQVLLCCLMTGV